MAVSEFDLFKINRYCASRVPAHHLNEMRVEYSVRGNAVTIVERRAPWHSSGGEWSCHRVAQVRLDPRDAKWSLYWRDRNARWRLFDLVSPGSIDDMLVTIDDDTPAIFWG